MVTAVITGGSGGLGREYIPAIMEQYPTVDAFWLIGRNREALSQVAQEYPDKQVITISLDLSLSESIETFDRILKKENPEIKVLVNNAGYGKVADFFSSDLSSQLGMVDLNCRAVTAVTRLCLPYMLDNSIILNIASVAAFAPTPRMSVYAATKSFILSLSKSLHDELMPRGIRVTAVCPGPMDTNFWDVAGAPEGHSRLIDRLPKVPPQEIAAGSVKAAKRGKMVYTKGFTYKLFQIISKILPHSFIVQFTEV